MIKGLYIFYYHLVSDSYKDYYLHENVINSKLFEEQVKYFSNKFEIITINEAYNRFISGYKFNNQLVLTTDDGFVENYSVVCNILAKYNVKGSFFLIENSIDNELLMWRHALFVLQSKFRVSEIQSTISFVAQKHNIQQPTKKEGLLQWSYRAFPNKLKDLLTHELWNELMPLTINEYLINEKPYLNSSQIEEIVRNGHVIGSHTRSHPICSSLDEEELKFETFDSVKSLANKFNTNVIAFSFPFERSKRSTEIIKTKFSEIKVLLGTKMKYQPNFNSPYYWERLNMETKAYKSRILIQPLKNKIAQHD
jgi:peptidoglycan/xylan/chitin deacetylase (PgdA/CDA1 family)